MGASFFNSGYTNKTKNQKDNEHISALEGYAVECFEISGGLILLSGRFTLLERRSEDAIEGLTEHLVAL
jgi:hypothetical protein